MGQNCQRRKNFKSGPRSLGRVKRALWGHFGNVWTRLQPISAVLAHCRPEPSLSGSHLQAPNGPKSPQNGSGDPRIRWVPSSRAEGIPPFPTRQLPTANRQPPPIVNRQPPAAANRQPTPTANRQPGQMGPEPVQNGHFKSGPRPLERVTQTFVGHLGPVLTRFRPFWPIGAQFLPCPETVMESDMGPKPVKNDLFQK